MSDHLPECSSPKLRRAEAPMYGLLCICDELRACEQRVLSLNPVANGVLIAQRARERALDAARAAIEAIPDGYKIRGEFESYSAYHEGRSDFKDGALSAIDALKGKNSG